MARLWLPMPIPVGQSVFPNGAQDPHHHSQSAHGQERQGKEGRQRHDLGDRHYHKDKAKNDLYHSCHAADCPGGPGRLALDGALLNTIIPMFCNSFITNFGNKIQTSQVPVPYYSSFHNYHLLSEPQI